MYVFVYLGHEFLHPYEEKVGLFIGVKYLQLVSDFCQKIVFFHILQDFSQLQNRFLINVTKFCSKLQIVDNPFTLHPKSITVLICCQIYVVKGCFFHNMVDFGIIFVHEIVFFLYIYLKVHFQVWDNFWQLKAL